MTIPQEDALWRIVGLHLRHWRRKRALTQEEAAGRSKLGVKRWQEYEAGRLNFTLTTLGRMAGALRVPPHELLRIPGAKRRPQSP